MTELSPEKLLGSAVAETGLDDFGGNAFREGLDRATEAFERTPLTASGRERIAERIVADLANRLRIEAWYKLHPEIERQEIEGPLLVCGLPRTGTTATVAMLALDSRFRFPRRWEGRSPVPPPVAGEEDRDPRAVAAREAAKQYTAGAMHLYDPDGPDEDLLLFSGLDMRNFYGMYPMPDSYVEWWVQDDFHSTFAYHARVLKLLQSRRPPNHWLLKAPVHLFKLETFAAQYPDAKFVMTHRDPVKIITSVASIYQSLYDGRWHEGAGAEPDCVPGAVDKHWTGRRALTFWSEAIRRGMAARAKIGEHRFVDVYNSEVVRDPIGTFEKLYDDLGLELDATLRGKLEDYHRRNAQGSHGEHAYTPEEYGLSDQVVRAEFEAYIDRFGV